MLAKMDPVFTFSLPGEAAGSFPTSVTPLFFFMLDVAHSQADVET